MVDVHLVSVSLSIFRWRMALGYCVPRIFHCDLCVILRRLASCCSFTATLAFMTQIIYAQINIFVFFSCKHCTFTLTDSFTVRCITLLWFTQIMESASRVGEWNKSCWFATSFVLLQQLESHACTPLGQANRKKVRACGKFILIFIAAVTSIFLANSCSTFFLLLFVRSKFNEIWTCVRGKWLEWKKFRSVT